MNTTNNTETDTANTSTQHKEYKRLPINSNIKQNQKTHSSPAPETTTTKRTTRSSTTVANMSASRNDELPEIGKHAEDADAEAAEGIQNEDKGIQSEDKSASGIERASTNEDLPEVGKQAKNADVTTAEVTAAERIQNEDKGIHNEDKSASDIEQDEQQEQPEDKNTKETAVDEDIDMEANENKKTEQHTTDDTGNKQKNQADQHGIGNLEKVSGNKSDNYNGKPNNHIDQYDFFPILTLQTITSQIFILK